VAALPSFNAHSDVHVFGYLTHEITALARCIAILNRADPEALIYDIQYYIGQCICDLKKGENYKLAKDNTREILLGDPHYINTVRFHSTLVTLHSNFLPPVTFPTAPQSLHEADDQMENHVDEAEGDYENNADDQRIPRLVQTYNLESPGCTLAHISSFVLSSTQHWAASGIHW